MAGVAAAVVGGIQTGASLNASGSNSYTNYAFNGSGYIGIAGKDSFGGNTTASIISNVLDPSGATGNFIGQIVGLFAGNTKKKKAQAEQDRLNALAANYNEGVNLFNTLLDPYTQDPYARDIQSKLSASEINYVASTSLNTIQTTQQPQLFKSLIDQFLNEKNVYFAQSNVTKTLALNTNAQDELTQAQKNLDSLTPASDLSPVKTLAEYIPTTGEAMGNYNYNYLTAATEGTQTGLTSTQKFLIFAIIGVIGFMIFKKTKILQGVLK